MNKKAISDNAEEVGTKLEQITSAYQRISTWTLRSQILLSQAQYSCRRILELPWN